MIDVKDLSVPVQKAVLELHLGQVELRDEARFRLTAIEPLWRACAWGPVIELLALTQSYLTAAMRVEEEREAA